MKAATSIIILLFTVVYIAPLGVRPMIIPDETRYAEIPREMLASGDWTVPTLDGLRYFEKPVLTYWLNAISISLFGQNAFAIRLPSALAVGISAILIFLIVRKFGDGDSVGLLTAAAFLTCFEVFAVGIFCVLDSVFSMFVTATLVFFFFAWRESASPRKKNAFLVLAGVSCGLAFLAKGFIAFVLPTIVIVPFLLWERQWKELLRIWWVPLAVAVLVALPWCVAIHLRENDFWRYFFWSEHVRRFISPNGGQHPRPFWYFIPVILGGVLPWSSWLPKVFSGLKSIKSKKSLFRFSICWFLFPFLFFSVSRGKLATYILPCFPPLIIVIIMGFRRWYISSGKEKSFTANLYVSSLIPVIIAAVLAFIQTTSFVPLKLYRPEETWKWIILIVTLLIYTTFLLLAGRETAIHKRFVFCCLAPVAVMFCFHFIMPDRFKNGKMPGDFLLQNSSRIKSDTILLSDNYLTPAVCWFYKRNNVYLLGPTGEFTYGLNYEDENYRRIDPADFQDFIERHSNGRKVVLIAREKRYKEYKKEMPSPKDEVMDCGFVMAEFAPSIVQQTLNIDLEEKLMFELR